MSGCEIVWRFAEKILFAFQFARTVYVSFDKSAYVPDMKSQEQERRSAAGAGKSSTLTSTLPLIEIPRGRAYIDAQTVLTELGTWREIIQDREPARDEKEAAEFKVLPDGRRYALHQGRRQQVISFVCRCLIGSGEGSTDDLRSFMAQRGAKYSGEERALVVFDGHCLPRDDHMWREAGFALDDEIDPNTVPVGLSLRTGECKYISELMNNIGEGALTTINFAERYDWIMAETKDTDSLVIGLYWLEKCFERDSEIPDLVICRKMRGTYDYIDVTRLYALLRECLHSMPHPAHALLCAFVTAGCDYNTGFCGVTHEKFWLGLYNLQTWTQDLKSDKRRVRGEPWQRLVVAAYSYAHPARLMYQDRVTNPVNLLRCTTIQGCRSALRQVQESRRVPPNAAIEKMFRRITRIMQMYEQMGASFASP